MLHSQILKWQCWKSGTQLLFLQTGQIFSQHGKNYLFVWCISVHGEYQILFLLSSLWKLWYFKQTRLEATMHGMAWIKWLVIFSTGTEHFFQKQELRAEAEQLFLQDLEQFENYSSVKNGSTKTRSSYICSQHTHYRTISSHPPPTKRLREARCRQPCNVEMSFLYGSKYIVLTSKHEMHHNDRYSYKGLEQCLSRKSKNIGQKGASPFQILNALRNDTSPFSTRKFIICSHNHYMPTLSDTMTRLYQPKSTLKTVKSWTIFVFKLCRLVLAWSQNLEGKW